MRQNILVNILNQAKKCDGKNGALLEWVWFEESKPIEIFPFIANTSFDKSSNTMASSTDLAEEKNGMMYYCTSMTMGSQYIFCAMPKTDAVTHFRLSHFWYEHPHNRFITCPMPIWLVVHVFIYYLFTNNKIIRPNWTNSHSYTKNQTGQIMLLNRWKFISCSWCVSGMMKILLQPESFDRHKIIHVKNILFFSVRVRMKKRRRKRRRKNAFLLDVGIESFFFSVAIVMCANAYVYKSSSLPLWCDSDTLTRWLLYTHFLCFSLFSFLFFLLRTYTERRSQLWYIDLPNNIYLMLFGLFFLCMRVKRCMPCMPVCCEW